MSYDSHDFRLHVLHEIHSLNGDSRDSYLYGVLSGLKVAIILESITYDPDIAQSLRDLVRGGLSLEAAVAEYNAKHTTKPIDDTLFKGKRFLFLYRIEEHYWRGFDDAIKELPSLYWAFDYGESKTTHKARVTRFAESLVEFVEEEIAFRSHVHSK